MTKWQYIVLSSWWRETGRDGDEIHYEHVWMPRDEIVEFAVGLTSDVGSDGWELVTVTTSVVALMTRETPSGGDYTNHPTHKLFFKRPTEPPPAHRREITLLQ